MTQCPLAELGNLNAHLQKAILNAVNNEYNSRVTNRGESNTFGHVIRFNYETSKEITVHVSACMVVII